MALALGPSPIGRGENLKNELQTNKERGKTKNKPTNKPTSLTKFSQPNALEKIF